MYFLITNKRHVLYFMPVVLSVILLAACTVQEPVQTPTINIQEPITHDSDWYLQKMQQSLDQSRADWQLLAMSALLKENKIAHATQLANSMPSNLTAIQQTEFNLLNACLSLHYNDALSAQVKLKLIDAKTLSPSQLLQFYQLVIAAHSDVVDVELLRAYISLQSQLHGDAAQKNLNATWHAFLMIPPQTASSMVINANEYILAGWLDLLSCVNQNKNNPDNLVAAFRDWQIRYPNHPAAKQIPDELQALLATTDYTKLNKVAVLLPLTGPGAVFSKAIQQGIEDAHNGTVFNADNGANPAATSAEANASVNGQPPQSTNEAVPDANAAQAAIAPPPVDSINTGTEQHNDDSATDGTGQEVPVVAANSDSVSGVNERTPNSNSTASTELKFYDTNSQTIATLVQQARQDGAQLIIGPLLKSEVEQVTNSNVAINVLALNQLENPPLASNVCYFSLSPEDEAKNAADHIWAQNKRAPLLLIPSSELGQRVVQAFSQQWYRLGGEHVYQQNFGDLNSLKNKIGSRDGMALNGQLVARAATTGQDDQTMPVTDENANATAASPDAIYIVGNQSELGLIKPMITMNIGAKNNIAFYASSLSAQGGAGTDFRFEMEGLEFSDIPLLSGEITAGGKNLIHQFNDDYNQVRLYAMGADAWQLAQHFSELRQQKGFSLTGETGNLQADSHCVLNRTLSWSRYSQGKIVPVR
jgi:uncharacterized protein